MEIFFVLAGLLVLAEGGKYSKKENEPEQTVVLPNWMEWGSFENFGKTQILSHVLLAKPTNLFELTHTVKYARDNDYKIRAAAHGHSWSPLFSDEDQMVVFTRGLKHKDTGIHISDDRTEVSVVSGTNTGELKDFLEANGLTYLSNVIIEAVEWGGIVGSISHGVGKEQKTIPDFVVEMRIVDHNGDLQTYDFRGDNAHTMRTRAVKGHLGLFGIVYDLTISVQDAFMVDTLDRWVTLEDTFYDLDYLTDLFENNWSVEIFWFPYNSLSALEATFAVIHGSMPPLLWKPKKDLVWQRIVNPSSDPVPPVGHKSNAAERHKSFDFSHLNILATYEKLSPLLLQALNGFLQWQFDGNTTELLLDAIHYTPASTFSSIVPTLDMEVAIDVGDNFENVKTAVNHVVEILPKYTSKGMYPMNVALEMRMVSHTDILLAPAASKPYSLYIEVLAIQQTQSWNDFIQDVADAWRTIDGCRFHWGKQWRVLGGDIDDFVRDSYDDNIDLFTSELEKSGVDPDHMFFNEMLETILYAEKPVTTARKTCINKKDCAGKKK